MLTAEGEKRERITKAACEERGRIAIPEREERDKENDEQKDDLMLLYLDLRV